MTSAPPIFIPKKGFPVMIHPNKIVSNVPMPRQEKVFKICLRLADRILDLNHSRSWK